MEPPDNQSRLRRSSRQRSIGRHQRTQSIAEISNPASHPWDGYVTGPENELAMAAVQAIARGEAEGISPLVIHGPSGAGKSRLLAGLVEERRRRQPASLIAWMDAQTFITACLDAAALVGGAGWSELRSRFRSVDLFILEDIQGLERAALARSELLHTLDALESTNAAVVCSARSAPATWEHEFWAHRLVNRLSGGLAAQITLPGLTSRRRYILQHSGEHGITLEADAVETLARGADSYRTLDGWISRITLEAKLKTLSDSTNSGQQLRDAGKGSRVTQRCRPAPLDAQTVAVILAEETFLAESTLTIDVITRVVAQEFGVRLNVLRGPSRRASVVSARHVAMHLIRTWTGSGFTAIGTYFGGRESGTVRYGCKIAAARLNADPAFAAVIAKLELRKIQSRL